MSSPPKLSKQTWEQLRDWLVPEEAKPTGMRPCGDTYSAQSIKRGERQRLRALLTAEADRAERGEVE